MEVEESMTRDTNLLETFNLTGISQIEVTFDIDANGILNVSAIDHSTGRPEQITISNDKGRINVNQIDRMLQDAQQFRAEDEALRKRVEARNQLESYLYGCKTAVENAINKLTDTEKNNVLVACNDHLQWLEVHPEATQNELEQHLKEAQAVCQSVMMKLHGAAGGAGCSRPFGSGGPSVQEIE